ncbi:MAG TPA: DinB family protein [Fimbriimonadaceae bacterium]|jgi:uncharacterized damage-inducible protein DinB
MSKPHFDIAPLPVYPEPYATLLSTLQDSSREWRDELGEPTPELIVWQPYPKGYSIGGVLLHIAEVEAYWFEEFCLGRTISPEEAQTYMSAEIDQYNGSWPSPPKEPISYYYDLLDKVRARTLETFKNFPGPEVVHEREWETTTMRWVVAHVIGHDSYHGGQAVLLHEMGKRVRRG